MANEPKPDSVRCFVDGPIDVDLNINGRDYRFSLTSINSAIEYKATLSMLKQLVENQQITIKVQYSGNVPNKVVQPDFIKAFIFSATAPTREFNVRAGRWISFEEVKRSVTLKISSMSTRLPLAKKRRVEVESGRLSDDLNKVFSEEEATKDFTFKVGDKSVKAHKFMLSARSPVFKRMFETDMIESSMNSVEIKDASIEAITAFLEFIYSDKYIVGKLIPELLYLADKYEVIGLKSKTTNSLMEKLDANNSVNLLIAFDRHQVVEHKQDVILFIAKNKDAAYPAEKKAALEKAYPVLAASIESAIYAVTQTF